MDTTPAIAATTADPAHADARRRHKALAGAVFLMPAEEAAAAIQRAAEWNSSLKPFNAFEVFLVDQMAGNSIRMEGCQHHERGTRSRHAIRAGLRWDEDRKLATEELGAKLPKAPAKVARQLQSTARGCDWMIDRWGRLLGILDAVGAWDGAQTALAFDLLGVPADLRTGPSPLAEGAESRREVARAEVDRLRSLKAGGLTALDGHERDAAMSGFGPDHNGELAAIRRYERACSRRFEWARGQLKAGRHGCRPDGQQPGWIGPRAESAAPAPSPTPPRPPDEPPREQARSGPARREEPRAASPIVAVPAPAPDRSPAVENPNRTTHLLRDLFSVAVPLPAAGNRHSRRAQAAHDRRNG